MSDSSDYSDYTPSYSSEESSDYDYSVVDVRKESKSKSKVPAVEVAFKNIKYQVPGKKKGDPPLEILKGVSGRVEAGEMVALLGASGAGKTTLLNYLSGRAIGGTGSGEITLNGVKATNAAFRSVSAYVTQDDIVPDLLTPEETLTYASRFSMHDSSPEERRERVNEVLQELRLAHRKDVITGVPGLDKGLSGGERKRVNIGASLVSDASLLVLDEPTSGLDSITALEIIRELRDLVTSRGMTVLSTIHQPSVAILDTFDTVIILARGRIVFEGPPADIVPHFEELGYDCPERENPADYALGLVTESKSNAAKAKEDARRVEKIIRAWNSQSSSVSLRSKLPAIVPPKRSFAKEFPSQFRTLLARNLKLQSRNPMLTKARFMQTIIFAIIVGVLYLDVGVDQDSVQNRQGALFIITANMLISALMGVLFTFPAERALFLRERSDGRYSTMAYYASKVLVDTPYQIFFPALFASISYWLVGFQSDPIGKFFSHVLVTILLAQAGGAFGFIISGATGSVEVSLSIAPVLFMPLLLFSGFLVNLDTVTDVLSWIRYVNPIKYAFAAMALNEFRGLEFSCDQADGNCRYATGEDVIDDFDLDADTDSVVVNILILVAIIFVFRIMGYFALSLSTRNKIPR